VSTDNDKYAITKIRNVGIVAHIDHGKSTLADRLMDKGAVPERHVVSQRLDSLSVERERGITVKSQTVRLSYEGLEYNIIDTPGHVDFSYEVGRSLAACEGILLVVDATQGIEAQTMAHIYSALERDLTIIPVLNKIDLPTADVERVSQAIYDVIGVDKQDMVCISAKTGEGIEGLFSAIARIVPHPSGSIEGRLQALLVDSWYDIYHGIVMLVRIKEGCIRQGDEVLFMHTNKKYKVNQVGIFLPKQTPTGVLHAGEIGYILAGIRDTKECHIGDTITHATKPCDVALPGFKKCMPVVFCGIFPEDSAYLDELRFALEKLNVNDSSFTFEPERSALGMGFRCGFLGILHLEVIQQRLEEEFDQDIVLTIPSVSYHIYYTDGTDSVISNPADFPDPSRIKEVCEPWIQTNIFTPHEYVGDVIELCVSKRGVLKSQQTSNDRTTLVYEMPLGETVFDFHDQLKLRTKGYASFDYTLIGNRPGNLSKVRILINGNEECSLSSIVHQDKIYSHGRVVCETLKEHIPRQNIIVKIQAAVGSKVIASESISAYRKDVTAKLYGGDRTRRDKLLKKQAKGKARMQQSGTVRVPNEAYVAVMKPKNDR
jgi:GTP-binding protein LepA